MIELFCTRFLLEYPDVVSDIALPVLIAIFALAFPLLLQSASRIDDKYNSTLLIDVFRKDWKCKTFIYSLLISLVSCGLWIFQLPRCVNFGEYFNTIIDNSSLFLLLFSITALVVSVFFVVRLMYIYYVPEELLKRLVYQYNGVRNNETKKKYYEAISKILFYSIHKEDETLARSLQEFYLEDFVQFRENKEDQIIDYPDYFYDILFDANELLCQRERKSISWYKDSFYNWLIDEYQHTVISEKTFSFLWKCIRQSLFYKKEEFVFSYWQKAHQYMIFQPYRILPQHDLNSEDDINRRNKERERFLEFHYALGGLLLKNENYSLLNQLTNWTNQTPPKYVLVPETMEEVICRFMQVETNTDYSTPFYYEQRYPFPDVSGVNAEDIIKMWIKRYIAVLFLHQYTRDELFVHSRTLTTPYPPHTLQEKRKWNEELDILCRYVNDLLEDESSLKALNMSMLTQPNWFEENNKPKPNDLIQELKSNIKNSSEQTKINQEIDDSKRQGFENSTREILVKCFDNYSKIFVYDNPNGILFKSMYFDGRYNVLDKMAFASEQDINYINSNSITAQHVVNEFEQFTKTIFKRLYNTSFFLIQEQHILTTIDHLELDSGKFIIISIGFHLHKLKEFGNVKETNNMWEYKSIPIIDLGISTTDSVNNSLYIIRKDELPHIIHRSIEREKVSKYNLKLIDEKYKIYSSIIDLNKNETLRHEVVNQTHTQDLSKSVIACVDVDIEIKCIANAKCIQLKVFSQFDCKGSPKNIEDVTNLWKLKAR